MVLSRLSLAPGSKELALSSPAVSRAQGHLRPAQILLTNHQTCLVSFQEEQEKNKPTFLSCLQAHGLPRHTVRIRRD